MNRYSPSAVKIGVTGWTRGAPLAGLPPPASANAEATGAVVVRDDLADALLGLDRSNTILTHR